MLAIIFALLLTLSLASVGHARTYLQYDYMHLGYFWASGGGGYVLTGGIATEAACIAMVDALPEGKGYFYGFQQCYTFTSYPTAPCSGVFTSNSGYHGGVLDRCSSSTSQYRQAGDSSCIYTGGLALTDAAYADSCENGAPRPSAAIQPYKRRVPKEQSPYIGGKVCPIGEQACPLAKGFGCVNIKENLNSCGGCIGGAGVDCSDIIGADEVACELGTCLIRKCSRRIPLRLLCSALPQKLLTKQSSPLFNRLLHPRVHPLPHWTVPQEMIRSCPRSLP